MESPRPSHYDAASQRAHHDTAQSTDAAFPAAEELDAALENGDASALPKDPDAPYVVGIGASAGGFEALEQFFMAMPSDSDMAFVVVQHLSPDHKSLMVELLSKHTRMKLVQASDGQRIEQNAIYLIPPGKNMTIFHGKLQLADKGPSQSLNFPIDIFFNSLAEDSGERAIAIILSGTGSDGARGIRRVKEQGGMIMVQDLASAKFDGMPSNAIATGLTDYILPPGIMPDELLKYIKHPFVTSHPLAEAVDDIEDAQFERIFSLLKNQTGIDFSWYKSNTVSRRIERRLSVNQIEKLPDYVNYLYQNPAEVKVLFRELLIGVTRFFRDTEAFASLKQTVLPEIVQNKRPGAPIRLWVAGCSTGEEAYSLAILFREFLDANHLNHEVKIFATDVDEHALEFASAGQYPESVAADMSSSQFGKYFVHKGDRYQISNAIREMVIFAQHNIIRDPPFNKIDLISCRNMLIYLQPAIQKKVMLHFNFGLTEDGFLFLGASETVGGLTNLFGTVDNKWKIFRCKGRHMPMHMEQFSLSPVPRPAAKETVFERIVPPTVDQRKVAAGLYEQLFNTYVPPCVVINDRHDLLHVLGDVSAYLKLQPGSISLKITQLIQKELAAALETGVNKARRTGKEVVYQGVCLPADGDEERCLTLRIKPFTEKEASEELLFVIFEPAEPQADQPDATVTQLMHHEDPQRVRDLEHELQYNRETLQATIEELETTNEELQATNEELLSANEELQSSNEELQSVNEELITVNTEYQSKIQELTELNNDVNNLLTSTSIGTIFLDLELRIRKFTPAITRFINLMDTDIGRPITHITFAMDYHTIEEDCQQVLRDLIPVEREGKGHDDDWNLLRIHPYRTEDNTIKGLVLNFIDISTLKATNVELAKLSLAVELSPSLVVMLDVEGVIEYVNKQFCQRTGYAPAEVIGMTMAQLESGCIVTDEIGAEIDLEANVCTVADHQGQWHGILRSTRKDGSHYFERASVVPIRDEDDSLLSFLKVSQDVTEELTQKAADDASHARQELLLDKVGAGFAEMDLQCRVRRVSPQFCQTLEITPEAAQGEYIWALFPPSMQDAVQAQFRKAAAGEQDCFQLDGGAAERQFTITVVLHSASATIPGGLSASFARGCNTP